MISRRRINKIEEKLQLRNVVRRLNPDEEEKMFQKVEFYNTFTKKMNETERKEFSAKLVQKITEREKTDVFSSDTEYQSAIMWAVLEVYEEALEKF